MTIDVHCHLFTTGDDLRSGMIKSEAEFFADSLTELGKHTSAAELEQKVFPTWVDPDGSKLLGHMDEADIEKSFILVGHFDLDISNPDAQLRQKNQAVSEIVARHPDRFVGFCGIHPSCRDAPGLIEQAVGEWGFRGIKLDPLAGQYSLDDQALYPIYRKAAELGIPILTHVGPRPEPGGKSDYGHPKRLRRPLADFPSLTFIAAHIGFTWWRDLISVAVDQPNLMCDISALQLAAASNPDRVCAVLRKVLDRLGSHRMLFGSDSPPFDLFMSRKEWVDFVRNLPHRSPAGIKFTEDEIDAILENNARRLLEEKEVNQTDISMVGKSLEMRM